MNALSGNETRRRFLDFFVRNGHTEVPSGPLIPGNDPTLLFTNAGMVPFKDTFLGLESRPYSRAVTAQKILRVSGKHNDLEEVGFSPRHHTFFEMLGNFSFGDYFKSDAIHYAWQLLTEEFALPIERLWFTVFAGDAEVPADDEAARLWIEAGAAPDRVLHFGRKDNFWLMGDTGPCGPCSEITVYIGDDLSKMRAEGVNSEDPDYVEIWNLVFMQFDKATMRPLPRPSIDTGMGLERICSVLQGVRSDYETDLFRPIIERLITLAGGDDIHYQAHQTAYRAVADHTRACAFLVADGILPGNGNRSYVLRRILRRAAYQGRTIGLTKPFLAETADVVIGIMGDAYPELRRRRDFILETLTDEEERFGRTISSGLTLLDQELARVEVGEPLPGQVAFALYDTFGFPRDLTERITAERGYGVDLPAYEAEMEAQRARGRAGAQFKRSAEGELWAGREIAPTEFVGYGAAVSEGTVLALMIEGDAASEAHTGQSVGIALDRTAFYAQGGGQVGDTGLLIGPAGRARVSDTQRPIPGLIVHIAVMEEGTIAIGDPMRAEVDKERRHDVERNHTATHLLHRLARQVLGEHAAQAGSLVAPDRLRFDFTHGRAVSEDQLRRIEQGVNEWIRADTPVNWLTTSYQEALDQGAMALFGEKYGDRVRMVTAGCEQADFCSRELCGGTHVARTGEIGLFHILQETSSAGGIRRIEAVTGKGAEEWAVGQATMVREAADRLGAPPARLLERIDGLLAELRRSRQQIEQLRNQSAQGTREALLEQVRTVGDVPVLAAKVDVADGKGLDDLGDWLRDKLGSAVLVLGAVIADKPHLLAVVTPDLTARGYHAGNLVKRLAPVIGGGGGGRPDRASAGGRSVERLDEALALVERILAEKQAGS